MATGLLSRMSNTCFTRRNAKDVLPSLDSSHGSSEVLVVGLVYIFQVISVNHILQLLVAGFYCPQLKPRSWKLSSPFNLGGRPTRQGVRARAVEKVQRQLAELPEEICVTNGLY